MLGSILPSFLIILIIAISFNNWSQLKIVQNAFNGLRPAVVALIAVPVIQIAKKSRIRWQRYWLPLAAIILIVFFNVSPIYLIIFTILFSWIQHLYETENPDRESN
ncbi:MAG: chromate transporter [Candidatus Cloacimonadaceae bacterium]